MKHNRTFFCPMCHARHRPKLQDLFVMSQHDELYVFDVEHTERLNRGFTSHIVEFTKSIDKVVHFSYTCAMGDCGFIIQWNRGEKIFEVCRKEEQVRYGTMPVADWNALIGFVEDGYELV